MIGENVLRHCVRRETVIIIITAGFALLISWAVITNSLVYFSAIIMLAVLPAVAKWPIVCSLGLYALLVPFDTISVVGEGTTGLTLTYVVGGVTTAILILVAIGGHRFIRPPRAAIWWLLFTLWGAVTVVWAVDAGTVVGRLPTSIGLFVVYLVAASISAKDRELSAICTFAILGGVLAAAYTVYAYSEGIFYLETSGRASLILGERETDPNQFAMSLLLPFGLAAAGLLSSRRGVAKALYVVAALIIAGSLFLTMSRGSLVALSVMILTYLIRSGASWRIWVLVAGLAMLTPLMPQAFFERLSTVAESGGAGRLDIWLVGLQALREHYVLGAGLSNFPVVYNRYVGFRPNSQGDFSGSHNIYLGMWVELGIVGLILMVAAVWSQVRAIKARRSSGNERRGVNCLAIECACYGVLVSGLFLDVVWRKAFWLPWILLALHTNRAERARAKVIGAS